MHFSYSKRLHLFIGTNPFFKYPILGKYFKVYPLRKVRIEKKVPGTLCLFSLSPSSRNTLHTDQVSFASPFKNSPNNVSCTGFSQSKSTEIKHESSSETIVVRIASATEENYGLWKFIF